MNDYSDQTANLRSDIKLLVVDDREDNLFSIETILEKDGYTIRTANSGRAALRLLLKEEDFTLILMDVQMPDLNGFETATLIYERDKLKHIPIIFITANDHGEDSVFKGYQMGGVDYLYKPINPELLRAKVAVLAELYRKNHQLRAQEQKLIAANRLLEKEVNERVQSENQVIVLNKQLVENITQLKAVNEELERFAYVASHDLQEPLRKIIIFSDQLASKYNAILKEEGCDSLERIMKASQRMRMLIKNILSFSRSAIHSGGYEETDINLLIDSVLSDLEVSIVQKQATIAVDKIPGLYTIPDNIRQLFQNLIINALKFSKPGIPPRVHIYARQVKGAQIDGIQHDQLNNDFVSIFIEDNGIGFEQKYANEIFTLFKRLNTYDKYEGTGIGLSICKKIVDQHKGYISATGDPGTGATFIISFPAKHEYILSEVDNHLMV